MIGFNVKSGSDLVSFRFKIGLISIAFFSDVSSKLLRFLRHGLGPDEGDLECDQYWSSESWLYL